MQQAASLALDARPLGGGQHRGPGPRDCWVLERTVNEKTGKLYTVIRVEEVRRTLSFFGSTAGAGGWRVCIVDTRG